MDILLIIGYCLNINSSANLCHISYIKGLLEAGYNIDLISADSKGLHNLDKSIIVPDVRTSYTYEVSKYEQYGSAKHSNKSSNVPKSASASEDTAPKPSLKGQLVSTIKKCIRNMYGVYSTDIIWYKNAKQFKTDKKYDIVISVAFPTTSHLLAEYLKKHKKVKADRWIQIWEDPWYADLCITENSNRIKAEERKLISKADEVIYVSPLTLMYQQKFFPESADKMRWYPVPSYYSAQADEMTDNKNCYGYFGDYVSTVRNLKPFYEAAKKSGAKTVICGNSNMNFTSSSNITVNPRLPLNELEVFEKEANVLVFLCNLKGGQIPGKIYQYSATYKKILFILDGTEEEKKALREYFEKFNRYIFCENTVDDILRAMKCIEKGELNGVINEPVECFSPVNIIRQMLEKQEN